MGHGEVSAVGAEGAEEGVGVLDIGALVEEGFGVVGEVVSERCVQGERGEVVEDGVVGGDGVVSGYDAVADNQGASRDGGTRARLVIDNGAMFDGCSIDESICDANRASQISDAIIGERGVAEEEIVGADEDGAAVAIGDFVVEEA